MLAVLVGEDLADAGLGTGLLSLQPGGQRAQTDEVEHGVLDVDIGDSLPHDVDP